MPRPSSVSPSPPSGADPAAAPGYQPPLVVEDFLTWLIAERGRSTNTVTAYRRDLLAFGSWLAIRGRSIDDAATDDVVAYIGELRSGRLAPSSVKRRMVAVRSLYRFRVNEGYADR